VPGHRCLAGRAVLLGSTATGPDCCGRRCLYGTARWRAGVGLRPRPSSPYTEPIGALSLTLDATFFALSDPKRRGILERLGRGPATLSQLAGPSGLTLNGIKKHVGILELAGLVETEKVGRVRECRLGAATTLGEAGEWIEAHRRAWEGRMDRFERFVERAT
jgi:DNA-binding transcriptional ArsR family regulator